MAAAALLVPFFIIVSALVLIGLSQNASAHAGSSGVKGFLESAIHDNPISSLLHLAASATRWLLSRYAAAQLAAVTAYFSAFAAFWKTLFRTHGDFVIAAAAAIEAVDNAVPGKIHKQVAPVRAQARIATRKAEHAQARARSVGTSLDRYKAHVNPRLHHATHAIEVTLPQDIAGLRARNKALEDRQAKQGGAIKSLEDGAVDTWDWIKDHPFSSVTGLFAGAVVVALSRLGYGFLRCSSWRKLGRSIKCSDANILGDLLALATGVLAAEISLSEFVRFMQGIEDEAIHELHQFIRP